MNQVMLVQLHLGVLAAARIGRVRSGVAVLHALTLLVCLLCLPRHAVADKDVSAAYVAAIEADWAAQEKRLAREAGSVDSIRAAVERAGIVLQDLQSMTSLDNVHWSCWIQPKLLWTVSQGRTRLMRLKG